MPGLLVLLIGPSGVGKTILANLLLTRHIDWVLGRSATTRTRRPGEGEKFYRFVTEEEFLVLEKTGAFLEWARVHSGPPGLDGAIRQPDMVLAGAGALYGTLRADILPFLDDGKIVLREIDIQGLESMKRHPSFRRPSGQYRYRAIFLAPESSEQLVAHIHKRAPMTEEELHRRLTSAQREMTHASQCDATIVSREGKIEATADLLEMAILQ